MKMERHHIDPRQELYLDLCSALRGVPGVAHVDLWNENVVYIEEDSPYDMPAVFVEFGDISWGTMKPSSGGVASRGEGSVVLHIVTNWHDGMQEGAWDLTAEIVDHLQGLGGSSYGALYHSQSCTNHNHEEILENIETFSCRYYRSYTLYNE